MNLASARIIIALSLLVFLILAGCGDTVPDTGTGDEYDLEIIIDEYDPLGTSAISYVTNMYINVEFYSSAGDIGSNPFLEGGMDQSSWAFTFNNLTYSPIYVLAYLDLDGSGTLSSGDPYEIYEDAAVGGSPTAVTLDTETPISITIQFDDTLTW